MQNKHKYQPTLEFQCACEIMGTRLISDAGRLWLSSSLSVGHDEFIIRDIREAIRDLNAALSAFDSAEPEMAERSARLLAQRDESLADSKNGGGRG